MPTPMPGRQMPGRAGPHPPRSHVPASCLRQHQSSGLDKNSNSGTNRTVPVLHTLLLYYGEGENATFSTTATSKIYPKNNSVQNRSVSEFKKKKRGEKKPLHEF